MAVRQGHTYQCWQCGQRVDQDHVQRTTVTTGRGPWQVYTRRVNICPACASARRRRSILGSLILLVVIAIGATFYATHHHSNSGPALTPSSTAAPSTAAARAATPVSTCTSTFDYIVRDAFSAGANAQVMPNINTYDCKPTLSEFARTFPSSRQGECITIALASDNPGYAQRYLYEPNAPPPPPLHKVIESTGSGC